MTIKDKAPIPQIHQIEEKFGYTFAITEFISGITLRDLLLNNKTCNIWQIMFDVGVLLNSIASVKFDKSGFFNKDLHITKKITQKGYIDFLQSTLTDDHVVSSLSKNDHHQINKIIEKYGHLLPDGEEKNLVHADFDPSNILVKDVNGHMEISGILDWEFSFSGSTLCDVANMLRYKDYMPSYYEDAFLNGLSSNEYCLPENWRLNINMLNLLALLDCMKRSNTTHKPNRTNDIKTLVSRILAFFQNLS